LPTPTHTLPLRVHTPTFTSPSHARACHSPACCFHATTPIHTYGSPHLYPFPLGVPLTTAVPFIPSRLEDRLRRQWRNTGTPSASPIPPTTAPDALTVRAATFRRTTALHLPASSQVTHTAPSLPFGLLAFTHPTLQPVRRSPAPPPLRAFCPSAGLLPRHRHWHCRLPRISRLPGSAFWHTLRARLPFCFACHYAFWPCPPFLPFYVRRLYAPACALPPLAATFSVPALMLVRAHCTLFMPAILPFFPHYRGHCSRSSIVCYITCPTITRCGVFHTPYSMPHTHTHTLPACLPSAFVCLCLLLPSLPTLDRKNGSIAPSHSPALPACLGHHMPRDTPHTTPARTHHHYSGYTLLGLPFAISPAAPPYHFLHSIHHVPTAPCLPRLPRTHTFLPVPVCTCRTAWPFCIWHSTLLGACLPVLVPPHTPTFAFYTPSHPQMGMPCRYTFILAFQRRHGRRRRAGRPRRGREAGDGDVLKNAGGDVALRVEGGDIAAFGARHEAAGEPGVPSIRFSGTPLPYLTTCLPHIVHTACYSRTVPGLRVAGGGLLPVLKGRWIAPHLPACILCGHQVSITQWEDMRLFLYSSITLPAGYHTNLAACLPHPLHTCLPPLATHLPRCPSHYPPLPIPSHPLSLPPKFLSMQFLPPSPSWRSNIVLPATCLPHVPYTCPTHTTTTCSVPVIFLPYTYLYTPPC